MNKKVGTIKQRLEDVRKAMIITQSALLDNINWLRVVDYFEQLNDLFSSRMPNVTQDDDLRRSKNDHAYKYTSKAPNYLVFFFITEIKKELKKAEGTLLKGNCSCGCLDRIMFLIRFGLKTIKDLL